MRRSRAALIRATVDLVSTRGTANVPLSDIAEAADVSRQLVYKHFGDRDTLLLEAALDLAGTEFGTGARETGDARASALVAARHFAEYRPFYRAAFASAIGFALSRALTGMLLPVNRRAVERVLDGTADPRRIEDLAVFIAGGAGAFINAWVVEAEDPLDPEDFAERLVGIVPAVLAGLEAGYGAERASA